MRGFTALQRITDRGASVKPKRLYISKDRSFFQLISGLHCNAI